MFSRLVPRHAELVAKLALRIINTPEFQRLRYIKQLGISYLVFPSANGTRFEHLLGTYHLAGLVMQNVRQYNPNIEYDIPELGGKTKINDFIIELVKIAALCHDLGHGFMSHLFDHIIEAIYDINTISHEERSYLLTKRILKRECSDIIDDNHINFINALIDPQLHHNNAIYQIVANKLNQVDVDKFDYLARDSYNLGYEKRFDALRIINEIIVDDNNNIAYPKHCGLDLLIMFHDRYMMHKRFYCHKTTKILELMVIEIIRCLAEIIDLKSMVHDLDLFCTLTDETFFTYLNILNSTNINENDHLLTRATYLMNKIKSRNLYKLIDELIDVEPCIIERFFYLNPSLIKDDFEIVYYNVGFVSENKADPFSSIFFYENKENRKTFVLDKKHISSIISEKYQERHYLIICKNDSIYQNALLCWNKYKKDFCI